MNICVYWEQYSWGGVDSYLKTLLTHWPDKKHNILILSNKSNKGLERIQKDLELLPNLHIKTISILSQAQFVEGFRSPGVFIRLLGYILFPFFLLQNFITLFFNLPNETDVLMSQNGSYPGGWSCLVVLLVAKIKKIQTKALVIHHSSTSRRLGWYWLEYLIDKMVIACSDKIIAVSKASLESFTFHRSLNLRNDQEVVIYNGVEMPVTLERKNLLHGEGVKIGLLGRCEERKGHFDILNALAFLEPSHLSQIHLFFIGYCDEEFKERIEKFCKQHLLSPYVTVTGYLPNSSPEIISNLDLLCCLTQDYEGFGLTVIEAMAAGVPVLSTDVGALKEFLVSDENCFIVAPSSPKEIADYLLDFLHHRDRWQRLIPFARKTAATFSAENMTNHYYELLIGH